MARTVMTDNRKRKRRRTVLTEVSGDGYDDLNDRQKRIGRDIDDSFGDPAPRARDDDGPGLGQRIGSFLRSLVDSRDVPDSEELGMDGSGAEAYDFRQGFNRNSVKGFIEWLDFNTKGELPLLPGDTDGDERPMFSESDLSRIADAMKQNPGLPEVVERYRREGRQDEALALLKRYTEDD